MTLDDLTLTDNLVWQNEYAFTAIEQTAERSLTGGLIVQEGQKQCGRPMRLNLGWLPRADLDALKAKENQASEPMELTLPDGRVFWVIFDRTGGTAIQATPVNDYTDASTNPTWPYQVTVNFLTVEPPTV
nr:hypothetical protein 9 [Saccharospirillaceae bacterium]